MHKRPLHRLPKDLICRINMFALSPTGQVNCCPEMYSSWISYLLLELEYTKKAFLGKKKILKLNDIKLVF